MGDPVRLRQIVDLNDSRNASFQLASRIEGAIGVVDVEMFRGEFLANSTEPARLTRKVDQ